MEPAPESKSLLVLFFRKEQESSFSEEKEAKRLLLPCIVIDHPGLGRRRPQAGWHLRYPCNPMGKDEIGHHPCYDDSMEIDWDNCSDIEIKPDVMSGAPVIRGTRVTAQAVLDNADDGYTAEEIVADIYPSLPVELTRRVIEFARRAHASAAAG